MTSTETRTVLLTAAFAAGAVLFVCAALELLRETQRVEVAVTKADLAASQVWDVLREAREITGRAAGERDTP